MLKVTFMDKAGKEIKLHKSGKISKKSEYKQVLKTIWKALNSETTTTVQVTFTKIK